MALDRVSHESQLFADAIMDAVNGVAKRLQRPDMGAVLGALVAVQARLIGGVEDERYRKALHRDVVEMLSRQIVTQMEQGEVAHTQVIVKRAN